MLESSIIQAQNLIIFKMYQGHLEARCFMQNNMGQRMYYIIQASLKKNAQCLTFKLVF